MSHDDREIPIPATDDRARCEHALTDAVGYCEFCHASPATVRLAIAARCASRIPAPPPTPPSP